VSGASTPPQVLDFFRSLGGNPNLLVTDPAIAGPVAVDGRAIPTVTISESGRIVAEGAQVAGDEPVETSMVGSITDGMVEVRGHQTGLDGLAGTRVPAEALERAIQACPLVMSATVVTVGVEPTVVVELARNPVARWAHDEGLKATTYRSFSALPELDATITSVVAEAAAECGTPTPRVVLASTPLSEVAGALGPGSTPRRQVVEQFAP
jgi:hypothetical protein